MLSSFDICCVDLQQSCSTTKAILIKAILISSKMLVCRPYPCFLGKRPLYNFSDHKGEKNEIFGYVYHF